MIDPFSFDPNYDAYNNMVETLIYESKK